MGAIWLSAGLSVTDLLRHWTENLLRGGGGLGRNALAPPSVPSWNGNDRAALNAYFNKTHLFLLTPEIPSTQVASNHPPPGSVAPRGVQRSQDVPNQASKTPRREGLGELGAPGTRCGVQHPACSRGWKGRAQQQALQAVPSRGEACYEQPSAQAHHPRGHTAPGGQQTRMGQRAVKGSPLRTQGADWGARSRSPFRKEEQGGRPPALPTAGRGLRSRSRGWRREGGRARREPAPPSPKARAARP